MTENVIKKSTRNVRSAIIYKLVTLLGPFIVRTILIYELGNDYVGLNSLFTSILTVLSLAELGVGAVLTYSMYKPVLEGDNQRLCALLNFYKKFYRSIGIVISTISLVLTPFIPFLIKGDYPEDINIYLLFWIYVSNIVISYLFFAYRSSLLIANQRNDVTYYIDIVAKVVLYIMQAISILKIRNFYSYVIFLPISTLLNNMLIYIVTKTLYPLITPVGVLNNEERKTIYSQLKALMVHRICGMLIMSTDNIVLSVMLGLNEVALYSNYYYIISALNGFIEVALASITSIVGTNLLSQSLKNTYESFSKIAVLYSIIVSSCTIFLFNLFQPFIKLWVGSSNVLPFSVMVFFCLYFYTYRLRSILMTYRDASGMWKYDVWKSIIGLVVNIVGDILLVNIIGISGVLIATIIVMTLVWTPWEISVLFKRVFCCNAGEYILLLIKTTILMVGCCLISYGASSLANLDNLILCIVFQFLMSVLLSCFVVFVIDKKQIFKQLIKYSL